MRKSLFVCVAIALLHATSVFAQDGGPDVNNVRVRIGPLMMNPTISVSNIGIDHNVFNDPPDKLPKEDFTFTVTPMSDFWLRMGPTWLTASVNESINWYDKYSTERSANHEYKLGWNIPGSLMNIKVNGQYRHAKERPGFEIDTRAEREETTFSGSYELHAWTKTYLGVTASRTQSSFAEDAFFLDPQTNENVSLRTTLNRVENTYAVDVRHQLTPLTSLTFALTRAYSDFEYSTDRNAISTAVTASASFAPAALIKGSASFGYSDFKPSDPTLPGYRGTVGSADLTYVLLGSTRFALNAARGVQYSYDANQPYYIQSRIGGSVAQQIFGPFDVQVRGDVSFLDYRDRSGVPIPVPDRVDRVTTVGIGVGFHMGKDLRLAFNVDQNNRDTKVVDHAYEKFLIGTSLTYGF